MAKGKRYSEEQIVKVLGEIEASASIASVGELTGLEFKPSTPGVSSPSN